MIYAKIVTNQIITVIHTENNKYFANVEPNHQLYGKIFKNPNKLIRKLQGNTT